MSKYEQVRPKFDSAGFGPILGASPESDGHGWPVDSHSRSPAIMRSTWSPRRCRRLDARAPASASRQAQRLGTLGVAGLDKREGHRQGFSAEGDIADPLVDQLVRRAEHLLECVEMSLRSFGLARSVPVSHPGEVIWLDHQVLDECGVRL